jgi:UDP-N-acetylmuramoylalanine--D-glutamate ligase
MRMKLADLASARVAIWGCGREGRSALRAIHSRFPDKTVTVYCNLDESKALREDDRAVADTLRPEAEDLSLFDVVVKSPGISPYKPPYTLATNVIFTSASALWFAEHADARTICVTGTKGKSTVTALIAHLLRAGGRRVALAGNIGLPLLELLDPPQEPDGWVIELSSFQARDFGGAPTVAVINNLYEEHLDWHGSAEHYIKDKLRITERAKTIVAPASLAEIGNAIRFGNAESWHVRDGAIFRGERRVLDTAALPIAGEHNAQNVCAALTAIEAAGENALDLAGHVRSFRALPHRLQTLGERDGIRYVNDSIATTPYASVEALRSLSGSATTILVGGFDRGVSWRIFVDYVANHPPAGIVTMGANGLLIAEALGAISQPRFTLRRTGALADAFAQAREITPAGGTIVLSPGAPSFDQFHDYDERGREFATLAGFDESAIAQIEGLGLA